MSRSRALGARLQTNTSQLSDEPHEDVHSEWRLQVDCDTALTAVQPNKVRRGSRNGGVIRPAKSPVGGFSILITEAPSSARCLVHNGAATACSIETTRTPSSNLATSGVLIMLGKIRQRSLCGWEMCRLSVSGPSVHHHGPGVRQDCVAVLIEPACEARDETCMRSRLRCSKSRNQALCVQGVVNEDRV